MFNRRTLLSAIFTAPVAALLPKLVKPRLRWVDSFGLSREQLRGAYLESSGTITRPSLGSDAKITKIWFSKEMTEDSILNLETALERVTVDFKVERNVFPFPFPEELTR